VKFNLILGVVVFTALLIGCGGGGGGGSGQSTTTLTLNPSTLSSTFPGNNQALNFPSADIIASVSPAITTSVYATITDNVGVLSPGPVAVTANSNGTYTVQLVFNKSLAAGTYTGVFTVKLCRDRSCVSLYNLNGGSLPYTLTVTSGIQILGATVNGVTVSPSSLNVKDGDIVTLQSDVPVGWSTLNGGVIISNQSSSSTVWSATLGYGISTPGSTAVLNVVASTSSTPTAQKITQISLTQ
jgi:hypothetical protein